MNENVVPHPVVVIDPGHGGSAAIGGSSANNARGANGLLEKDLTLKVAQAVAAKLSAGRFQTFLTRADDRNLSLQERATKAREAGADAFISIHFNEHRDSNVDGTEVFVSSVSDEKDFTLANEILKHVSQAASTTPRGVRQVDFTVLSGDFHIPKTAACLIEMAYLSNRQQAQRLASLGYIEKLALALAKSVEIYANGSVHAKSFAQEAGETAIAEAVKEHADPKNALIDFPEPGKGTDTIRISIPSGLKFSHWQVEVLAISTGAGYKVSQFPKPGAEGGQTISVDWWHLPYGKIKYKLIAYASPDGKSTAMEKIMFNSAGWMEKAKNQVEQGLPMSLAVKGEKARQVYEAIRNHQASQAQKAQQAGFGEVAVAMEPITITVVILAGIVIFGILVVLGLLTLGTVIKMALDKGYDVKDTKYKAGVGEGQTKQEHEIAFNLIRPDATPVASPSHALGAACRNTQGISKGHSFIAFEAMKIRSDHPSGKEKNVFLRWNDIPANSCELDVVVHFHGYDIHKIGKKRSFFEYVEEISGLRLSERAHPTLGILPFGRSFKMKSPEIDKRIGYNFPFLSQIDGLQLLLDFALQKLAERNGLSSGDLRMGRLILTAHSGGGAAVARILALKKYPVDEVHLFDAVYGCKQDEACQYRPISEWAKKRIASDHGLSEAEVATRGGALRVIEINKPLSKKIMSALGEVPANLRKFYRVEETDFGHDEVSSRFGPPLLGDAGADLALLKPTSRQQAFPYRNEDETKQPAAREANYMST